MTDLTRTLNVYYTASQFVDPAVTQNAQPAMVDEKLIYPLIKDASQFQVALTKCKVPLDNIPLSQSNIPLKGWEIQLRKNGHTGNAYVSQVNSNVATNFVWSANLGVVSKFTYSNSGSLSLVGLIDVSATIQYITMLCVDDYQNLYVIGRNSQFGLDNLFFVFSNSLTPVVYFNSTGTNYTCVAIDRNQTIYLADQNIGVDVFTNVPNETSVTLTFLQSITRDFNNIPLKNIATVCSDSTTIIGYELFKIQVYNSAYNPISNPITLTEIKNLGNQSSILHDQGTFILSDSGVVIDNLYGQIFGGTQANNIPTATQAFIGSWNDVPHPQQSMVTAMGVGNDGNTYTVTNNPTADPVLYADDTFATHIASNIENSWLGLNSATNTLNYVNPIHNSDKYVLATDFNDTSGIFDAFDIEKTSGISYQVAHADSKLYKSNLPIAPLTIYTGIPTGDIAETMKRWDIFPSLSSVSNVSNFDMTPYLPYHPLGMYEFLDGSVPSYFVVYVQLSQDPIGTPPNFALYVYRKSDMHVTRFSGYNGNSGLGGGSAQPVAMCQAPGGLCCIYNGFGGFYCYDQVSLALETNFSIPYTIATGIAFSMCISGEYLIICNGTSLSLCVYNLDLLGNFTVYGPYDIGLPTTPYVYTNVYSMMSTNYDTMTSQTTITYLASNTDTAFASGDICTVTYDTFASPYVITPTASYAYASEGDYETNLSKFNATVLETLVDSNQYFSFNNLNYLTVAAGGIYTTPTIDIWYQNPTGTGRTLDHTCRNLPIPYFVLDNNVCPMFIGCANNATSLYTYNTNVPTSLDGTLGYITFSTSNEDAIYATDTSGVLYQGSKSASPIVFTIHPTFDSLNYKSISGTKVQSYNSSVYLYALSNQSPIANYTLGNYPLIGLTRNVITGQYFSSTQGGTTPLIAYPASTLLPIAWTNTAQLGSIFAKNGENIDSGPVSIYTYQTLIDAINVAFLIAFNRANVNGAGLVSPPSISMNFQTGLCTLHYDGEYANSVNGILTSSDGILFNNNLNNLIRFNSKPDTITPSLFLEYLTTESGTSPYSTIQNTKTITVFNKLDKILVQSNTIYVAQSYFGNNQTNNVITDIDIDTSAIIENVGQWLLYQPNFLRPFLLASNNAIDRIQLMIGYSYIDGTTYQLLINPDQGWNLKLDFVRKFSF